MKSNGRSASSQYQGMFGDIEDRRLEGGCDYPLIEIITIAVCAVIAGADSWTDIETFGKSKVSWLRQCLKLEHGSPSQDSFGDVFRRVEAEAFQRSVQRWIEGVFSVTTGQVMAIDGQTMRGSQDQAIGQGAMPLVNAWATANGISLGQRKVDDKANEITAIPDRLDLLSSSGCIVTLDAIGCPKRIAHKIRDNHADDGLCLKGHQTQLRQAVQAWFRYADPGAFQGLAPA